MAEVTRLEARYISRSKLEALLEREFGNFINYTVKSEGDMIEVIAPRQLTQDEIQSVTTIQ